MATVPLNFGVQKVNGVTFPGASLGSRPDFYMLRTTVNISPAGSYNSNLPAQYLITPAGGMPSTNTTVTTAATSSATTLVVQGYTGFPTTTFTAYIPSTGEEVSVTAGFSTTSWTVTRAQNGTTGTAVLAGAAIWYLPSATAAQENLDLLIQTISLRGQPVILGAPYAIVYSGIGDTSLSASDLASATSGTSVVYVLEWMIEHQDAWYNLSVNSAYGPTGTNDFMATLFSNGTASGLAQCFSAGNTSLFINQSMIYPLLSTQAGVGYYGSATAQITATVGTSEPSTVVGGGGGANIPQKS